MRQRISVFIAILFSLYPIHNSTAAKYSEETLAASGIITKDGMYFCAPRQSYIRPYDTSDDVEECAYANEAQRICSQSLNTKWLSGRCFCPEQNQYLEVDPRGVYVIKRRRLKDRDSSAALKALTSSVAGCSSFKPRVNPYGRSVILEKTKAGFTVKLNSGANWDDRSDVPGEQGSPHFPTKIASVLNLPLGFGYNISGSPVLPTFEILVSNLKKVTHDVSFFEVDGELTGREYLQEFINGRLPIARIENTGDATYFLHDLNFHVSSLILLPSEIRNLAQKQTKYLLDFIDYFTDQYPKEWAKSDFKLMMQKLLEDQVRRVDSATGILTQELYHLLENESSLYDFLNTLSKMNRYEKSDLHSSLMAITDGGNRFCEKRSVKDFLEERKYQVLLAFEEEDITSQRIFEIALASYIKTKESDPEFTNEIPIETYDKIYRDQSGQLGISAVELLVKRIEQLHIAEILEPATKSN